MLRVAVVSSGDLAAAAADCLRGHGLDACTGPAEPVALAIAVVAPDSGAGADPADVVLTAADGDAVAEAVGELYPTRLGPWVRAVTSGRPDGTAPARLLEHDPGWTVTAERRARALGQAVARLDPDDRLGCDKSAWLVAAYRALENRTGDDDPWPLGP